MKNIWIVHHHADPPDGHWTYTFDLMKVLAQRGYTITIFSSSYSHYSRKEERLKKGEWRRRQVYDGVEFEFVRTSPYQKNDWRRLRNMVEYSLRTLVCGLLRKDKPDIVITAWPPPFGNLIGWLFAKKFKSQLLFEVHDLWPVFLIESGLIRPHGIAARFLGWMEKFSLSSADRVMGLWPRMSEYFVSRGIPLARTLWLPMGIDFDTFVPQPPPAHRADGSFTVMYRGRFGNTNDTETIIAAAEILAKKGARAIRFVLVGGGPEREKYRQMALDKNLDTVTFEDFLPREQIFIDMARADVLIGSLPDLPHFGKYGMISTKVIEYLCSNRPVIFATNNPTHLVVQAQAGLVVPPRNPQAMAGAIEQMSTMSLQERIKCGEAGLCYLKKYHGLTLLADRLESIFEKKTGVK